jgi:hypothetical protein
MITSSGKREASVNQQLNGATRALVHGMRSKSIKGAKTMIEKNKMPKQSNVAATQLLTPEQFETALENVSGEISEAELGHVVGGRITNVRANAAGVPAGLGGVGQLQAS